MTNTVAAIIVKPVKLKVVIYGSGKLAEFVCYSFMYDSPYEVVAFCVDSEYAPPTGTRLMNLPVVSSADANSMYSPSLCKMHIAIGRNNSRERIYRELSAEGYSFANYISSKAQVWPDLVTGQNLFFDQMCQIHPFVSIGNNTILIGAKVGHHAVVGNNVLLSGTTLAGNVRIGDNSFLGINSCVRENVVVGSGNIIGAGAFVNKSTDNNIVISSRRSDQRHANPGRVVLFK